MFCKATAALSVTWLVIFVFWINLTNAKAYAALHIEKHLSLGRYHHTASAKLGILTKGYRCADKVRIGVIAKKSVYNFKRIVTVGALQGATDNDIYILSCNFCKIFVKIKIIAGKKSETQTLYFQNVG